MQWLARTWTKGQAEVYRTTPKTRASNEDDRERERERGRRGGGRRRKRIAPLRGLETRRLP